MLRKILTGSLILFIFSFATEPSAQAAKISVSCGAVGQELKLCQEASLAWGKKFGHEVKVVSAPNDSSARLGLYLQLLAAKSDDIDVFVVDTTWPGILSDFFLDLKSALSDDQIKSYFPAFIKNNTVDDRLVALPWWMDAGLLYYRKDLLEKYNRKVPTTWAELTETAKLIMKSERENENSKLWGYVFQGRAYEGLTCNGLEWIASFGGGTIVDSKGEVTVNNPNSLKALEMVAGWIGEISPVGALNYAEEEVRGVFQTGNAIFMRNWPYAFRLGNSSESPIRGRFGIAPLPKGDPVTKDTQGKSVSTLGGWSLAVSKFSKHPKEAMGLIQHLTSEAEQRRRALEGGFYPVLITLYDDPALNKKLPELKHLKGIIDSLIPRPAQVTGHKYNKMSAEFWEALYQVLTHKENAKESLEKLEKRLLHISRKGKW